MAEGWVSVHRKITEHWLWNDKPFSKGQAWLDILILVNHKDNKFLLPNTNELVEVKRGEHITSELKLADRWGWSKTKVRNFLQLLEKDFMIENIKSERKRTRLKVLNYNDYQGSENHRETTGKPQRDHGETTKEPQENINNNENNENNEKNDNNNPKKYLNFFEEVWMLLPRKKIKKQVDLEEFKTLYYDVGEERILKAVELYKKDYKDKPSSFITYGSTFLNEEIYDYLKQVEAKQKELDKKPRATHAVYYTDEDLHAEIDRKHKEMLKAKGG